MNPVEPNPPAGEPLPAPPAEPLPSASVESAEPIGEAPPVGTRTRTLIRIGCAILGVVFLTAAAAKIAGPSVFLFEVQSLPLLEQRGPTIATASFVLLAEISLGLALLLGWRIRSTAACGAILMGAFLGVLAYRAARGEADSCTCFGDLWVRPLPVALAMDAALLLIAIASAVFIGPDEPEPPRWKTWAVTSASLVALPATAGLFFFAVPLEPVDVGQDLRRMELPEGLQHYRGDHLIIVINTECPWCKGQWPDIVKMWEAAGRWEIPPTTVGVFGGRDIYAAPFKIEGFRGEMNPPMEMVSITAESTVMRFAATKTPAVLLVRGGRVQAVWGRFLPSLEEVQAAWKALPGT
jgi:hypothetical protein